MMVIQNGKSQYLANVALFAVKRGTVPGERGILHVDPKSSQIQQREPMVSEADAATLVGKKLAVRKDQHLPEWSKPLIQKLLADQDAKRAEANAMTVEAGLDPFAAMNLRPDEGSVVAASDGLVEIGGRAIEPTPEPADVVADGEVDPDAPPAPAAAKQAKPAAGKPAKAGQSA